MIEFSQEQSAAAFTESKNALCLAGAGSGKTRVLIGRIWHLIENCQVSPYEIMCCTFTRKAAGEMRERLEKSIGSKVFNVTIGTLHSIALNHIQRFGESLGLNPGRVTVYSDWEEGILLRDVAKELGYHTGKAFKGVKKADIDKAFYLFYTRKSKDGHNYAANEIMEAFFLRCRENNALTYGMLMTSFLDLIPRISGFLRFKHVLVDEIQDLDNVQWRIIELICSICGGSLFVVGDDSQSIYSFRGADPGYLIRNQDEFDIYKLRDNYRSDGYIVEAANRLIEHNINRINLKMNAIRFKYRPVQYFANKDSESILRDLRVIRTEDFTVGVLARNHFLLKKLSLLLSRAGIDHEYIGKKTAFIRSEEFRRVHALLNLAVNRFDNFSFMICLNYFEISNDTYKKIRMYAVKKDRSHFEVFRELGCPEWIAEYLRAVDDQSFKDVLEWMYGVNFKFDSAPVFEFIEDYIAEHHEPTIREYLDWLALFEVQDEIVADPQKLQLMTIHASKGLEFDKVIIVGMNKGILPSFQSLALPEELESERRLAYVAYTRARNSLVLTSRPLDLKAKILQPPSRFIKESSDYWG